MKTIKEMQILGIKRRRKDGKIVEEVTYRQVEKDKNGKIVAKGEEKTRIFARSTEPVDVKAEKYKSVLKGEEWQERRLVNKDYRRARPGKNAKFETVLNLFVVVRRGNTTPFFYPHKNNTNVVTLQRRLTQTQMLRIMLGKEYNAFRMLYHEWRTNPKSKLLFEHGYTYQQSYSYEGDNTQYFTFLKRTEFFGEYKGGKGIAVTDYLSKKRQSDAQAYFAKRQSEQEATRKELAQAGKKRKVRR